MKVKKKKNVFFLLLYNKSYLSFSPLPAPSSSPVSNFLTQPINISKFFSVPIPFSCLQILLRNIIPKFIIPRLERPLSRYPDCIAKDLNHIKPSQDQCMVVIYNGIWIRPINSILKRRANVLLVVPLYVHCILAWIKW